LDTIQFAEDLEKMLKEVVAEVKKVGKKWFIFPEWQVTLITRYSTTATLMMSFNFKKYFRYTTDEGATEFRDLLQDLCYVAGTHVVHFWGMLGLGS